MKTAKEILQKDFVLLALNDLEKKKIIAAMEEYANQQSSHPAQGTSGITVKDFEDVILNNCTFDKGFSKAAKACYALALQMQGPQVDLEFAYWCMKNYRRTGSKTLFCNYDTKEYKTIEQLLQDYKSQLSQQPTDGNK